MGYGLPKSVEIAGEEFSCRYDYRVIMDIFEVLNDIELSDDERALAVLEIFYPDFPELPDYNESLKKCFEFINGGKEANRSEKKQPQLVNWKDDFSMIVAPVNRVLGYEIRSVEYDPATNTGGVHWYTFLSAYMEMGDCLFAQVVGIRDKKAKGKPLSKTDKEFYKRNRDIIDIKQHYTEAENDLVSMWTGGANNG